MDFGSLRKKFEIDINIKKWYRTNRIHIEYEQATMYEINEFLYEASKEGFQAVNRVIDFVVANTKKKLSTYQKRIVATKYESIFETLQKTYFKGAFEERKEEEKQETSDDLVSSYIVFLSGELKQDPLYLMKNYTIEQLKFFTEGVVWNLNEQTEEGKKKNRMKMLGKRNEKLDKTAVKNLLQQLNDTKCNEASK